jgi:hypothetical protein
LEQGIPFISTPFGFEGYNANLIDNKYCNIYQENEWVKAILEILSLHNTTNIIVQT